MSLEEFKVIYWMEYAHRMWGRALGFVFAVPAVYFGVRGYINVALAKNLGLFFLMGGTQGLVGWWMVKSGLQVVFLLHDQPHLKVPLYGRGNTSRGEVRVSAFGCWCSICHCACMQIHLAYSQLYDCAGTENRLGV